MQVPHFFQTKESVCGPACLRMMMAALGNAHDEAAIAGHCNVTPLGCTVQDLVDGARAFGFGADILAARDDAAATAALSGQSPFVAVVDLAALPGGAALFTWHFVVPLAVASDEVIYHDPADGPNRHVALADFLVAWATAGYRGVRLWIR